MSPPRRTTPIGENILLENMDPKSPKRLKVLARDLIDNEHTMALATAQEGRAWVAPVYYVYFRRAFCFFSDPSSRHIRESIENAQASATIYPSVTSWQEIRGIQMSGSVQEISSGRDAIQTIVAYVRKFPFTKDFFKPGQSMDPKSFAERFKVRLYRLVPDLVYYLDNGIQFGFRQEIVLDNGKD